ncbi:uncharacterized protein RSE6_11584 [Rhynchosporium secalis]|uniref:Uncharacterized protein n=1 Tax=Rhynchosporium secalis TaxID=38038 RepID=A0A1E1MNA7_RHYSE|nr:uncharacterized protein RSE6_11584 [Rhynchosporium secalis]
MCQALLAPSPWQKLPDALCSPKLRVTYISPLATYNSYKFQDGGETFTLDEVDECREEKVHLEECADFCEDVIAGWLEGGKERYVDGLFEFLPSRGLKNHYINGTRNDRVHGGNLKLVQTLLDLGRLIADGRRKELQYCFGCHPTDSITSVKEIEIRNLKATGINLFIGTKLSYLLSQKQNRCWLDIMNKFDAWKEDHRSNTFGVNLSLSKQAKLCAGNPLVEKVAAGSASNL